MAITSLTAAWQPYKYRFTGLSQDNAGKIETRALVFLGNVFLAKVLNCM